MPAGFQFLESYIGIWVPLRLPKEEMANRDSHYLQVVARTKPGVALDQAQTNIKTIMAGISRDYPGRSKEIAVRTALGAGRSRLVRQLLTESIVLSTAGGAGGLIVAVWSFSFLQQLIPPGLTLFADPRTKFTRSQQRSAVRP